MDGWHQRMHACCRAGPADPWDGTVREALQRREICSGSPAPAAAAAVPQMPCRSRYALLAAASASAPQKVLRAVRIIIPKRPPYPTREERERESGTGTLSGRVAGSASGPTVASGPTILSRPRCTGGRHATSCQLG
jgi:hypothetical protein